MADVCTQGVDTGFVALGYAKVAVLGVVQGITELLPISSTAHMRIVPALLGWKDPGSAFSAAMQLAALARLAEIGLGLVERDIGEAGVEDVGHLRCGEPEMRRREFFEKPSETKRRARLRAERRTKRNKLLGV